jgi:hypothetical protein
MQTVAVSEIALTEAIDRRWDPFDRQVNIGDSLCVDYLRRVYLKEEATMWTTEHSLVTIAASKAIWGLWADVEGWPEWNADLDRAGLSGPFAAGSTITMSPRGQEPIVLRIAEAEEPELFVDEADLGDVVVRTTHRLEHLDRDVLRVVYRMEITGAEADAMGPQIGPEISADFPQVMAALVERAER